MSDDKMPEKVWVTCSGCGGSGKGSCSSCGSKCTKCKGKKGWYKAPTSGLQLNAPPTSMVKAKVEGNYVTLPDGRKIKTTVATVTKSGG